MPLLRTVGRTAVIAGTASAVSGRVNRRQQQRWNERSQAEAYQQQQQAAQAPPPPPPSAAPEDTSMDQKVEELKKLAELKEQGILTEEEFAAQKARILG